MKNRYLAMILGAMVVTAQVPAALVFAEQATESEVPSEGSEMPAAPEGEAPEMAGENTESGIKGTVKSIDESSITIVVSDTEEEMTIPVTAETVISGMQGGMGGPGGDMQGEPPAMPEGGAPEGDMQGEPPAMPEGEAPSGDMQGEPPAMPEGEAPSGDMQGEPPAMPEGEGGMGQGGPGEMQAAEMTIDDIKEGDQVTVTLDDSGNALTITVGNAMQGGPGGGMPGGQGGQGSGGVDSYAAANEYSSDQTVTGLTISSTGTDENAALVDNGASVTFDGVTVTRESEDSTGGDNSSFYGVGSAILATDGTAYVTGSEITTNASGAAGAFAYGDGTVYIADTTIDTSKDTSGGIHAAGGGTLYAWNVDAETDGQSAAAIRSDRGGTMVIDGGTYTSNGVGSPAIYSTADISVNDAELTATGSEAICIEGLNSIRLYDSDLSGNMSDDAQNDNTWTVILYQSMSGDSEVGNSTFQMDGGTLTSENGGLFYTTNTESTFILRDVDITAAEDSEFFLQCTGNNNQRGWGQSGSNGADCNFTGISQEMNGDVIWDSISNLDFYLSEGSTLTGAVINDESYAGNGGEGYCNLYVSSDSTWVVTGDSSLTSLQNEGTIVDSEGNTVTIVGTDGTVYVQGESSVTVTVGEYADSADMSGASEIDPWESHSVERPENI